MLFYGPLLPVSGLSASGMSENLCGYWERKGGLHVCFGSWIWDHSYITSALVGGEGGQKMPIFTYS